MTELEQLRKDVADADVAYDAVFDDTYDGREDALDCYDTYYDADLAIACSAWERAKKELKNYLKEQGE